MTTAALISGSRYLGAGTGSVTGGVSGAAGYLAAQFRRLALEKMRTARGQAAVLPSHAALVDGYLEAQSLVPSGEQVLPTSAALNEAVQLLEALPSWCAPPSPIIEPSGAISFEWDLGPGRWLVLAVKGTGAIEHSAMLGLGNEQYGTRNFTGRLGKHELKLLAELMHPED